MSAASRPGIAGRFPSLFALHVDYTLPFGAFASVEVFCMYVSKSISSFDSYFHLGRLQILVQGACQNSNLCSIHLSVKSCWARTFNLLQ